MALNVEKALVLLMAAVAISEAAVYKVGDSAGWTTIGNIDYKSWAASKNFQVGDKIIFQYSPQFHNVMRVTHAMYKSCNASSPLATFTTGNDTINITNRGHHFFFCGVPGHCQAGQKVDINVPKLAASAPTPSALVSPVLPPSANSDAPAPSSNMAASLMPFKGAFLGVLGLALVVSALVDF